MVSFEGTRCIKLVVYLFMSVQSMHRYPCIIEPSSQKGEIRFFHKMGGDGKTGGCIKKGGTLSLIFILTNLFQSYLSLSE